MAERHLPLTALVASRNEAEQLDGCLGSIGFCDEVVVIDLESTDATRKVAEANGARVVPHAAVPIAEWARVDVASMARHDWLLFLDPDEEVTPALARELVRVFPTLGDDVGVVFVPWEFYFGRRALRGTIWGGANTKRLLVRRSAVELTPTIWGGTYVQEGYVALTLTAEADATVRHYWVSGYRDWIAKHRRYLALEAHDRAAAGEITGLRAIARTPWRSFHDCFVVKRGYLDGPTGFALSVLWAIFRTSAEVALFVRLRRGAALP